MTNEESRTKVIVSYEGCEERSRSDEIWTDKDLIDAYLNRTTCDPREVARFDSWSEAEEYVLNNYPPSKAYIQSANVGHVVLYEVATIEEVILDEDGEVEEYGDCVYYANGNDK